MTEQILQMVPMWVLAGLSAGWFAENTMTRRGHGLIVDIGLGAGGSLVGASLLLALSRPLGGMLIAFSVGFVLASSAILAQRLCWPCLPGAQEDKARQRLVELARPAPGELEEPLSGADAPEDRTPSSPKPTPMLVGKATTGIYLIRHVPRELQRAARLRARSEGITLSQVLQSGLREYAAGTWTPGRLDKRSRSAESARSRD